MNKAQRLVAGIALILIGVYSFIFIGAITHDYDLVGYLRRHVFETYHIILLGMIFMGAGIFLLVSKKRR